MLPPRKGLKQYKDMETKNYEQENLEPLIESRRHYKDTRTVFIITAVLYTGMFIAAICLKQWHDIMYIFNVWTLIIYAAVANNGLVNLADLAIVSIKDVRAKADIAMLTAKNGPVRVNLNDKCKVTLTEAGAKIINEYYQKLHEECPLIEPKTYNAGDELEEQLYELAYIFDKHMTAGSSIPFVCNSITFDKVALA